MLRKHNIKAELDGYRYTYWVKENLIKTLEVRVSVLQRKRATANVFVVRVVRYGHHCNICDNNGY